MQKNPTTIIKATFGGGLRRYENKRKIAALQHQVKFIDIAMKVLRVFILGGYSGIAKHNTSDIWSRV